MRRIIIDCDPGIDDAIAIILALHSKEVEVVGITIAAGNASQSVCSQNALRVLELCNRLEVPVYEGAEQPLTRELTFSDTYCGVDGLGESKLEKPNIKVQDKKAMAFIIEAVNQYDNLDIVSIAPMTNIAEAIQKAPHLEWDKVTVLTMAGYYKILGDAFVGRPRCEWNVLVDPEAFEIVVKSGIQFKSIGLDITAQLHNDMVDKLTQKAAQSRRLDFLKDGIDFNLKTGLKPYSLLVDAMPMAYAIDRSMATFKTGSIAIDCMKALDEHSIVFQAKDDIAHLQVATSFDFEKYIDLLLERVFFA
ncbi:MAG: nucleoside hydrolase [Niameybacter sp.]